MWILWILFVFYGIMVSVFLAGGKEDTNSFDIRLDALAVGVLSIPVVICGGMRFWISKIQNEWLALGPYVVGLAFAEQSLMYGVFLYDRILIVFQLLSAGLLLMFLPAFVSTKKGDGTGSGS